MEALENSQDSSEDHQVVKQTLKEIYLQHEADFKQLQVPAQTLIMKMIVHISKEWNKQYQSLTQQIKKTKRAGEQIKEQAQKDHDNLLIQIQRLTTELQEEGSRHNNLEDYLNASKSELEELKYSVCDVEQYRKELQSKLIDQSMKVSNLEAENLNLIQCLQAEKMKNKRLQLELQELSLNLKTLSMQYQYEFEKASKLSSNLSQKEQKLKELKEIIGQREYIHSVPIQHENTSGQKYEQSSINNDKKYLNEEVPHLRCSQSQNPLYIPMQEGCRSSEKKSTYNPKTKRTSVKHDMTSQKKIGKQSSKGSIVQTKKPTTSSAKNAGNKVKIGFAKSDKSEVNDIKDRLKLIFKDRVKYRIQEDLKYCHKLDSLRCKLRAKEIENQKLNDELSGFKKQRKHERVGSAVLNSKTKSQKSSSRKLSRQDFNQRWLESDIKAEIGNPMLNTSYNELTERHSQQEQTTPKKTESQFPEEYNSENIDTSNIQQQSQLEEFYLNEQQFGHHLLNLEIDSREDMSFKNSQFFNSLNNSLNCSTRLYKKQRQMSINSQDFELIMFPNTAIKEQERAKFMASLDCSPNTKNKFSMTSTQKQLALSLHEIKDMEVKVKPPSSEGEQHILITSYLDTERKPQCSVSGLQIFYQQAKQSACEYVMNTDFSVKKDESILIRPQSKEVSTTTQVKQFKEVGSQTETRKTEQAQIQTTKCGIDIQMQTVEQAGSSQSTNTSINTQIDLPTLKVMLKEQLSFKEAETATEKIQKQQEETQAQTKINSEITQVLNIVVERMIKERRALIQVHTHSMAVFPFEKKQCGILTEEPQVIREYEISQPIQLLEEKKTEMTLGKIIQYFYLPAEKTHAEAQCQAQASNYNILEQVQVSIELKKHRSHELQSKSVSIILPPLPKFDSQIQCKISSEGSKEALLPSISLKSQNKKVQDKSIETEKIQIQSLATQTNEIDLASTEVQTAGEERINIQIQTKLISMIDQQTESEVAQLKIESQLSITLIPFEKNHEAEFDPSYSLNISSDDAESDQSYFTCASAEEDWYSLYTKSERDQTQQTFEKEKSVPKIKLRDVHMTFDKRKSQNYHIYIPDIHSGRTRSSSGDIKSHRDQIRQEPETFQAIEQENETLSNYSPDRTRKFVSQVSPSLLHQTINEESSIYASQSHVSSSPNRFDNLTLGKESHINEQNTCSQFSPERAPKIVKQYKLTQKDQEVLADNILQFQKYEYVKSQDRTTELEQLKPFSVKQLRVLFCSNKVDDFKFAIWKGKILSIAPKVHLMELPMIHLCNIMTSNHQVIMGNGEVTIANDKLYINRRGKIRMFKGQMLDGEWKINHTRIYELKAKQ